MCLQRIVHLHYVHKRFCVLQARRFSFEIIWPGFDHRIPGKEREILGAVNPLTEKKEFLDVRFWEMREGEIWLLPRNVSPKRDRDIALERKKERTNGHFISPKGFFREKPSCAFVGNGGARHSFFLHDWETERDFWLSASLSKGVPWNKRFLSSLVSAASYNHFVTP